ncbi:hypothetical protein [Methylobacterium sp. J-090]|uniref:hypothetical protein n=1 Tax=Methylobacterium sp. J-090 TaxID=2836666 RepID=UPI001FB8F485|nr:hypothetical protein [Methylobacterium sp. J-090]MCJ2082691.1 hypothetical protein [Methylobacterium sp. J-090]
MAEPAPDTFADLDSLAAKDTHGRLWRCPDAAVWSYPGAPLDASAKTLRVPMESVPDSRVQAALAAEAWAVAALDTLATPIRVLAVVKAPPEGVPSQVPMRTLDLGTAAAATA